MFCPRCSNECDDNLLFCPKCGYKINSFIKDEKANKEIKGDFFDEMIVSPVKKEEEEVDTFITRDVAYDTVDTTKTKTDFFDDIDDFDDEEIPPILARNKDKKVEERKQRNPVSKSIPKQESKSVNKAKKETPKQKKTKSQRYRIALTVVIAVVAVVLAVLITYFVKKSNMTKEFNKCYNQGDVYYTEQKYREAKTQFINAASNAFSKEQKIKAYEMIYQIDAILGGYTDEEIKYLELLVEVDPENIEYYKNLIVLYQNNNMESKVTALINSAPTYVKEALADFDGTIPVASVEAGTYNKPIDILLSTMDGYKIYYSLTDTSSGESQNNIEYSEAISIEKEGSYSLSAYSVSSTGVESKELIVKYVLDFNEVDPPVVNLDSGAYTTNKKVKVTAQEGCTIYYTTTGVVPTTSSKQYKKAIELPDGDSMYYFVAINEDGVTSDVVTRVYSVTPNYAIDYDSALNALALTLVSNNVLENKYGEFENGDVAYFEYTSIEEIDENAYYIITCEIETKSGSISSTKIYAVSCDTGECYNASKDGISYSISEL